MLNLPDIKCYTINLLPRWCELDCDNDKINDFLRKVEKWYSLKFDENSPMVWCWTYDPEFEYQCDGVVGITFNHLDYVEDFKRIFGCVEFYDAN